MWKQQGKGIGASCMAAIVAILMAVFAADVQAQYNGECWAADYYNVYKISGSGQPIQIQGFSQPLSLSINPNDGSCWVADTDAVRVRKISASGQELLTLEGIFQLQPRSVSVDSRDGSCWVATVQTIYKFSADGKQLAKIEGFDEPVVAVNPTNGDCWVANSNRSQILRLSATGEQLGEVIQIEDVTQPKFISVNPKDGSCWVADAFTCKVVKLSPDGKILAQTVAPIDSATMVIALTASTDGGCWVAVLIDTMNDSIVELSADGQQVLKVDGFAMPSGLAADPKDGGCWVANTNGGEIMKISAAGQAVASIGNLTFPKVVEVASPPK